MGGRTLPTYCEHGKAVDWGDFGPDDLTLGEHCPDCDAAADARGDWAWFAAKNQLTPAGRAKDEAERLRAEVRELLQERQALQHCIMEYGDGNVIGAAKALGLMDTYVAPLT